MASVVLMAKCANDYDLTHRHQTKKILVPVRSRSSSAHRQTDWFRQSISKYVAYDKNEYSDLGSDGYEYTCHDCQTRASNHDELSPSPHLSKKESEAAARMLQVHFYVNEGTKMPLYSDQACFWINAISVPSHTRLVAHFGRTFFIDIFFSF